ncbi:hypothetical protein JAAARDRAFT_198613 [Jaapia argillacea MUCL 33604]|uniref:Uncharacterized protein n=1 Tax=Jaapia argillacea MUCL 33604 TaxID=933084 RepID=A0A067PNP7_9AGAM|nr:hypothetical protein JAAARDRAFT_198613 [Jaapia argillacea MUCL 33604]
MPVMVIQLALFTTILVSSATALPVPRSVVCHPTTWHDIIAFFVVDYITHDATISTAPGAKCHSGSSSTIPWWVKVIGKGSGSMLEPAGDPEQVYIKLPTGFHDLDECPATLLSATILFEHLEYFIRVARSAVTEGYCLAYPETRLLPEIFPFNSPPNRDTPLSRSQSWLKMAISVAQLCYSSAKVRI